MKRDSIRWVMVFWMAFVFGGRSEAEAAVGRKCRLTVVSAELATTKPTARNWDRTPPGHPDPRLRIQVGAYLFKTKMGCNTSRPVWKQNFDMCLWGREPATLKMVDVDRVTEDYMGATEAKTVSEWFGPKVFRNGGRKTAVLRFGSVFRLDLVMTCDRQKRCATPPRKRDRIDARFVWKMAPPRYLLYRVEIPADKLARYKKDAMQIEITHWSGTGKGWTKLKGLFGVPGPGQWNAFPYPLLCLRKLGAKGMVTRKAKVLLEIRGSPTVYTPVSAVQSVLCR